MGLLPSKPMVQRRAMVRSLTSRISTSGGSGGSENNTTWCYGWDYPSEGLWVRREEEVTLYCQLNDASVLTKGVDGVAGEET